MQSTAYYLNKLLIVEVSNQLEFDLFLTNLDQILNQIELDIKTIVIINYTNYSIKIIKQKLSLKVIKDIIITKPCKHSFIFSYPINDLVLSITSFNRPIFIYHLVKNLID